MHASKGLLKRLGGYMKLKKNTKNIVRIITSILSILLLINISTIKAKAVAVNYDAAASVSFSYSHYNTDSSWLCAEYVSRCLNAGGVNMTIQKGVKGLYETLSGFDNFAAYQLPYKAGDYRFYATGNNAGKISVGDVIIVRGNDGSYLHAVLVSKIDSKGVVYFNAHNASTKDGEYLPTYTSGSYSGKTGNINFTCFHYTGTYQDTTPPSITDVSFPEQDNNHFKIRYTLSDNLKVVKDQVKIYCPHKTLVNTNENSDNGTWVMNFYWKDMPDGNYYCTITAWDAAGNNTTVQSSTITKITPDTTKPTISNVKISDITDTGYTVTCTVSDNVGVTKVQFPTWTDANGQDDLKWHNGTISGNTATYRVNISDHNNERGCYYNTHIYAYDAAGNEAVNTQYIWVPASTGYKVLHYKQELTGGYTKADEDKYSSPSGTVVNPSTKSYKGFSTPSLKSATVKADGTTVVEYYYDRNSYNLAWNFDGGKASGNYTNGSVKYEQSIVVPTVSKEGYKFLGWDKTIPDKMPDSNLTITAKWEKETNNSNNNNNNNNQNNNNQNNNNNSNNTNNNNSSNKTNTNQNTTNTNNNNTSNNNGNNGSTNQNNGSVSDFVARFYVTILGREADESGLNHWTSSLLSGEKTGADVAKGFVLSPEFVGQNNSNSVFVNKMYEAFFNRDADDGGFNNWMTKLANGTSREEVLAGFVKSQEFKDLCAAYGIIPGELTVTGQTNNQQTQNNNQSNGQRPPLKLDSSNVDSAKLDEYVERLYLKVLGRGSEPAGKEYWKKAIINGRDDNGNIYDAAIAARKGFFESKEYKLKNRTDDEFLYDLYGAFFNREPDPEGFAYWHDKMKYEGYTRQRVIDEGFGHSQEFKNLLKSYGFRIIE